MVCTACCVKINCMSLEYPDNPYYKVALADVYVGLTDEQALRLARRHSDNSHFVHKVTHRDLVSSINSFYQPY